MGHTPFGYRIENGAALIDKVAAAQIKALYSAYLDGLSLESAASEAGIKTYHGTVKRMMENKHYLGDDFYPAIIDRETFYAAQEERKRRAARLGRNHRKKEQRVIRIPTAFTMKPSIQYDPNPKKQAEYLYSLIESEV